MRICTLQNLLLIFTLLVVVPLAAQHTGELKATFAVPVTTQEKPLPQIFEVLESHFENNEVADAVLLRLKKEQLPALLQRLQKEDGPVVFEIPAANGQVMALQLEKNKLLAEGFKVRTPLGTYPYQPGQYLRGTVKGSPQSLAALSVFNDLVMGVFAGEAGNYVLGPLRTVNGIASDEYILYNEQDLKISNDFACFADELPVPSRKTPTPSGTEKSLVQPLVKVYFECDYLMYQEKGSNSTNVINFVTGAFNAVATIYNNESILTQISEVFVWTTQDPYRTSSSVDALTDFRNRLNTNGFNGDLAHLLSRTNNNLGGVAYRDVLCVRNYAYAYSNISSTYQNFPTYSWTVNVITHEMGHSLGSPHTQSCEWAGGPIDNCFCPEGSCSPGPEPPATGGTIMSYCHLNGNTSNCTLPSGSNPGVNLSAGFGQLPGDLIRNRVNNASCLEGASPRPNLTVASGGLSTNGSVVNANITVTNNGGAAADSTTVGFYLSTDFAFSPIDYLFATRTVPALANGATSGNIVVNMDVSSVNGIPPGVYYIIFFIDKDNTVGESNENDNIFYWNSPQVVLAGTCPAPTSSQLTVTNITTNSARFNCSMTGVSQYDWQYRLVGAASWTGVMEGVNNYYNASGLVAGAAYEFQTRVRCDTTWSIWSPSLVFSTTAASCAAPTTTQISASNITSNAARLNCTVTGVTQYDWQYRVVGTTTWVAVAEGTSNFFNLSNLAASTNYEFQVRVLCNTTWSSWSASRTFTTSAAVCNAPATTQLSASNILSTSAQLNCTLTGVTQYDWQYRRTGTTTWTALPEGTAATYNLTGLTASASYEFQARVQCGTVWSAWSASVTFTTAAPCNAPSSTQTSTSNITTTAARLNCSVTGVTQYDWQYRRTGTTTWSDLPEGSSNFYDLGSLTPGTGYEFQVRVRCGATQWSNWSASRSFTTTTLTCARPTTSQITATAITGTTAQLNHTLSGYSSYGWRYRRSGTSLWTTLPNTISNFTNLTGLSRNTRYEFQVQVFCNNAWTSWSAGKTFTTASSFDEPGANALAGTMPSSPGGVNAEWELKAYPQPATDILSIEFRVHQESPLHAAIYDLTGKVVKTIPLGVFTPGTYTSQVTVESLHPGIYLLQVIGNEYNKQVKIVIQ
ncbi:MAG: M12 family metallo-peptidase [Saprospiraceae bacterium]